MKTPTILKFAILIALLALPSVLMADTYIRQAVHQDAVMNNPPNDDTTYTWMTEGLARSDTRSQAIIVDTKADKMYILDHAKKTYMELPLEYLGNFEKLIGIDTMDEQQAAAARQQMQSMKSMMQVHMTITPTDETSKIKDWNCKKYLMEMKIGMATVNSEAWVTNDVKMNWTDFWETTNAMMFQMPGADQVMQELKKMDGLPVKTTGTASVMGNEIKTTSEVLEISTKAAPAGTYDLPKDYTKEEFEFGGGMK